MGMAAHPLLPDPECLTLDCLSIRDGSIVFAVRTTRDSVCCLLCGCRSNRVHSHYRRRLLDLPWQGNGVCIEITARRFFCDNRACLRRVFTEPIPRVAARYARKTARLADALQELTLLVGGEAAARIAAAFGLVVSPDALLNALKKACSPSYLTPRVLGVDDFAFRRGRRYGTILVDLERRCPIDLLPDREPDTLVAWLQAHPGIEIISRDRGGAYIEGATRGAPDAVQVADRFHLVKNLGDALERFLLKHYPTVRQVAKVIAADFPPPVATGQHTEMPPLSELPLLDPLPSTLSQAEQRIQQLRRQRRLARFEEVKQLQSEGCSLHEIARRTGLGRNTIRRYTRAQEFPEIAKPPPRQGKMTSFAEHLRQRWRMGCCNAVVLYEEIVQQGFTGSLDLVQRFVHGWRAGPRQRRQGRPPPPLVPVPRRLAFLLTNPEHPRITPTEQNFVAHLLADSPVMQTAQSLALGFCRLVRERDVGGFAVWLAQVFESEVTELKGFARGLLQDRAAVEAALSSEWSNGQVEGQVNRLKFLKRSMYGRGGFDLLKARVLHRTDKAAA
jgi:transposase